MKYLMIIAIALFLEASVHGGIIQVPTDQPTIQNGINAASQGDTVLVAEGRYIENINFSGKAITIASHFILDGDTTHTANTIIDGGRPAHPDSGSVVYFISGEDTTSILTGFTITGGTGTLTEYSSGTWRSGGGIYCRESGARISNNRVFGNVINDADLSTSGGGILAYQANEKPYVIIEHNVVRENVAESGSDYSQGGGISFYANGKIINNSIIGNISIAKNQGGGAGIVFGGDGPVLIQDNTVMQNEGTTRGNQKSALATICGMNARVEITNNDISENAVRCVNTGAMGAGIYLYNVREIAVIRKNTIAKNRYNNNFYGSGACYFSECKEVLVDSNFIIDNIKTGGLALARDVIVSC